MRIVKYCGVSFSCPPDLNIHLPRYHYSDLQHLVSGDSVIIDVGNLKKGDLLFFLEMGYIDLIRVEEIVISGGCVSACLLFYSSLSVILKNPMPRTFKENINEARLYFAAFKPHADCAGKHLNTVSH